MAATGRLVVHNSCSVVGGLLTSSALGIWEEWDAESSLVQKILARQSANWSVVGRNVKWVWEEFTNYIPIHFRSMTTASFRLLIYVPAHSGSHCGYWLRLIKFDLLIFYVARIQNMGNVDYFGEAIYWIQFPSKPNVYYFSLALVKGIVLFWHS